MSYSISGGIGFKPAQVLLKAVVYARGDGPACVMPPPGTQKGGSGGGGDGDYDNADAEEGDEEGQCSRSTSEQGVVDPLASAALHAVTCRWKNALLHRDGQLPVWPV